MKLEILRPSGVFQVNSYLLVSDKKNAIIIDTPPASKNAVKSCIENGITVKKILLTHGHCDHIECLDEVEKATDAEVYIHTDDAEKLTDSNASLFNYFGDTFMPPYKKDVKKLVKISDGDIIELDEIKIKVMHTPGHTSGGVCYITEDMIFCGDTLFMESIGRTDMPDGNMQTLQKSLEKIAEFKGEYKNYRIYPGHGSSTTLLDELDRNPYLRKGLSYDDLF